MPPEPSWSSTVYPGTAGQSGSVSLAAGRPGVNGPVCCGSSAAPPSTGVSVGFTTSDGRFALLLAGTQARVGSPSPAQAAPQAGQRTSSAKAARAGLMGCWQRVQVMGMRGAPDEGTQ